MTLLGWARETLPLEEPTNAPAVMSRAMGAEYREGEQADRAGPENGDGPARHIAGQADRVHGRRQRLDERRSVIVEDIRYRVQPVRGQGTSWDESGAGVSARLAIVTSQSMSWALKSAAEVKARPGRNDVSR